MHSFDREELFQLADAAIEGRISERQLAKLERWVLQNSAARKAYTEYVWLSASLRIAHVTPVPRAESDVAAVFGSGNHAPVGLNFTSRLAVGLLTLAIASAIVLSLWFLGKPSTVATLVETKGCKWGSGTLPTVVGAQLMPGQLRLEEGLAKIVFSSGAELLLESPTDLELVSPMKCVVRTGRLIAHVPLSAKGFIVETPFTVLKDYGTEFGVSVGDDHSSVVQVFQGRVDAVHRQSGQTEVMYEGAKLQFGETAYGPYRDLETSVALAESASRPRASADWIQISTARGRGRETFVMPQEIPCDDRATGLVLVKRPYPAQNAWERRAFVGFDLAEIAGKPVVAAELSLCFAPTGLGFSSQLPDARFSVYGLNDCDADAWSESELHWENAPAGGKMGQPLDTSNLQLLGSFIIPQGQPAATVVVSDQALTEFLNTDTNQLATLIIVRETAGIGLSDLVHGFAGRRHPSLPPPTLRLVLGSRE